MVLGGPGQRQAARAWFARGAGAVAARRVPELGGGSGQAVPCPAQCPTVVRALPEGHPAFLARAGLVQLKRKPRSAPAEQHRGQHWLDSLKFEKQFGTLVSRTSGTRWKY